MFVVWFNIPWANSEKTLLKLNVLCYCYYNGDLGKKLQCVSHKRGTESWCTRESSLKKHPHKLLQCKGQKY